MRLIYITVALPLGSSETYLIAEATELLRREPDMLIVPRSPGNRVFHTDAAPLMPSTRAEPLLSWTVIKAALRLFARHPVLTIGALLPLFLSRNPSVFFKNVMVFPKSLWLARLAAAHEATHIHAQWAATTATMAMVASHITGIPWSFTAHRGDIVENNLLRCKLKRATVARFISRDGLELARMIAKGCFMDSATVLHLGVAVPGTVPPDGELHDPPLALCPALLIPRKGHRYVLEAVRLLRNRGLPLRVLLVGDGPLKAELEGSIDRLKLGQEVALLGRIPHESVLRMYERHEIDFVVLPTIHEGISVALMEAMSYGVPVVGSDAGGNLELLGNGAALVVPPQDAAALAAAVQRLLTDEPLRKLLMANGRKRVVEEFAAADTASALLDLLSAGARRGIQRDAKTGSISSEYDMPIHASRRVLDKSLLQ